MKPNVSTATVTSTLVGRKTKFRIGNEAFVMQALADLYSDISEAIIREYSTNAFDANVELAIAEGREPEPIEVTLPSMLSPDFVVKDNGVGMTADFLNYFYTAFGDSDKRDSDESNGMLGFGCKAGAAYTTSFTVTSIKDGLKTEAVVTRDENWNIEMVTLDPVPTDEHSGTEVRIPIHNINEFTQKAHDFYRFWLPGRVLVNGAAPEHYVGSKITDNLYFSRSNEYWNKKSYIVMSNVAYPINNPDALFAGTGISPIGFVAYTGKQQKVDFANNREALKYTDNTKTVLKEIVDEFAAEIKVKAQQEIDNAATHFDAFMAWTEWGDRLGRSAFDKLTYKGDELNLYVPISGKRYQVGKHRDNTRSISQWEIRSNNETIFVTKFPSLGSLAATHKRKVRDWFDHTHTDSKMRYVVFTDADKVDSVWVDQKRVFDWETIKAQAPKKVKEARTGTYSGRLAGSFDYWDRAGYNAEQTVPSGTVYWISLADSRDCFNVVNILKHIDSDAAVVILPANRVAKFKRDYPHISNFIDYARGLVIKDGKSLLDDKTKAMLALNERDLKWAKRMNLSKVDDPYFATIKDAENNGSMKRYTYHQTLARITGSSFATYHPARVASIMNMTYPMYRRYEDWQGNPDVDNEWYIYMNAAYALRKDSK